MDELLDAVFALGRADFAVEVLAADDVRGELAPERRDFAVGLLEDQLAVLAFDLRAADFPVDGREEIVDVGRAEGRVDLEPAVETLGHRLGRVVGGGFHRTGSLNINGGHRGSSFARETGILPV